MILAEALNVIMETCKAAEDCDYCPLRNYDGCCYLQDIQPSDWTFQDKKVPPMVFK